MPLKLGTSDIGAAYLGTTSVAAMYLGTAQVFSSAPAFDPDAAAYIAAVEAPGADNQQLEAGVRSAINAFVVGCKADGIWDAIKASCIMAGARTLSGALVPLKGAAPTNFNFVSGDYNRKTGLIGDGSTKYLGSNRNNNADPQNSKHVSVFGVSTVANGSVQSFLGPVFSTLGWTQLAIDRRSPSGFQPWVNGANYPGGMVPIISQSGFFGASRAASDVVTARNGGVNAASTASSRAPSLGDISIFGTGTQANSTARFSFYSIGEALDLALLDARVSALMTAIDGAIP
jgi:hypothetical protein